MTETDKASLLARLERRGHKCDAPRFIVQLAEALADDAVSKHNLPRGGTRALLASFFMVGYEIGIEDTLRKVEESQ